MQGRRRYRSHARLSILVKPIMQTPELPEPYYFYNLKQSIDDPHKPFNEDALNTNTAKDSENEPSAPLYSQTTLRRTISPITDWIAFNPGDSKRIEAQSKIDPNTPVTVGYERRLFEVLNNQLRPIYWSIPYSSKVTRCHWVFSQTLSPIDPIWDEKLVEFFKNFLNKIDNYKDVLERVQKKEEMATDKMKEIIYRAEFMQAGKPLHIDVLFSPVNNLVYLFKAESSYAYSKSTADALLSGNIPRGILCILKPFDFKEYREMYSQPERPTDDVNYEPKEINNLILVFHGIGQKLSDQYSKINFVYAIDKLRVEVHRASENPEVFKHFPEGKQDSVRTLVLPVNWRSVFNTANKVDFNPIIVPSLGPIRQAFSDAMLDIPLYMSENRRPDMLNSAAIEANRLYKLVMAHNPHFEENGGRTHVIGHSLGSLITADLLTHQPTVLTSENIEKAPLKFSVHNYFTTGSMLGVFMKLKGVELFPRKKFDEENSSKDVPFGCFAVKNLYNIIDQNDLLSFLVNSTVTGAQAEPVQKLLGPNGKSLEADVLPSSGVISSAGSMFSTTPDTSPTESNESAQLSNVCASKTTTLGRIFSSTFFKQSKEEPPAVTTSAADSEPVKVEKPEAPPAEIDEVKNNLKLLNENGQIDWMIPHIVGYIPSHYLKMVTAHFDYWSNKDMARFLAIECSRKSGEENTLPEHRAKWTYNH